MCFREACMPEFNFSRDIDVARFKWTMQHMGEIVATENLADFFEEKVLAVVVDRIKNKKPLGPNFCERYGFSSEESFFLFLEAPPVLKKIEKGIGKPEDLASVENLSPQLLAKFIATYQSAQEKQMGLDIVNNIDGLTDLFDIFELIKNLSDEEIAEIDKKYPEIADDYTRYNSLTTFRDDLLTMNEMSFEEKYEGCYAGMLNNVILPIIFHEQIIKIVRASISPQLDAISTDTIVLLSSEITPERPVIPPSKELDTPTPEQAFIIASSKKEEAVTGSLQSLDTSSNSRGQFWGRSNFFKPSISIMEQQQIIDSLRSYIAERESEWEFHYNFLGIVALIYFIQDWISGTDHFNSKSRETKISAANKLYRRVNPDCLTPVDEFTESEKRALNEGRLGRIVAQHHCLDN
jgi:hypothetical protein